MFSAIDLRAFLTNADKQGVVDSIRRACSTTGFVVISGHGVPLAHLEHAFASTRAFFEQPQREKDRWHPTGPSKQRGYHGVATRGLAYTLDASAPPDLRESIFLGPMDDHRSHYAEDPSAVVAYWPNTIPTEPSGVDSALGVLYRDFERLSASLLRIMACALDMPEHYFDDKIDRHFSILGCHHYPALLEAPLPGQLRTGAHTDFGAMTILAMTEANGGLEVDMGDDRWVPVVVAPDELVVNLGDMMARWTNDRWASTLHRVANPAELADSASQRQSIGYFMHPNFDAEIECFPTCLEAGQQPKYPTITAGEHIASKIEKSHSGTPPP
jgi:isopenicillin N synthase-like dioxygenase